MSDNKQLEQQLWNIANTLRGKMDADEFRDYILGFIFYKYLSEKMRLLADKLLSEDNIKYIDINENTSDGKQLLDAIRDDAIDSLGYFLKPSELFSSIVKRTDSIIEELETILRNIEQSTMDSESADDFGNLFEDLDLNSTKLGKTVDDRNTLISKVIGHLDKIDFEIEDVESDILGDAYEYLIAQFASGAGKKAGEFYTPQEVSKILAKIVTADKQKLKSVYDPTCGSGSLLLRVAKEVKEVSQFYGQELNRTTYNLARMNMIMHDVHYKKFDIKQEDTLERPQHLNKRFEAIVANPPFSAKWSSNNLFMTDERFSQYGKLAPSSKADYAFVTHMIHHLDDNGTLALVLPHGALFRGAAEGHIRQYLIREKNYLDAVIGLPSNIFYGTSIPTCIMVFKKNRNNKDVLFIDASEHYEKVKTQNVLREEHIEKIVSTYSNRTVEDKFSYVASNDELIENEYNLNIPRYIDTFEEEEQIDLEGVSYQLGSLDGEIHQTDKMIEGFCEELGINPPH